MKRKTLLSTTQYSDKVFIISYFIKYKKKTKVPNTAYF